MTIPQKWTAAIAADRADLAALVEQWRTLRTQAKATAEIHARLALEKETDTLARTINHLL